MMEDLPTIDIIIEQVDMNMEYISMLNIRTSTCATTHINARYRDWRANLKTSILAYKTWRLKLKIPMHWTMRD
jgi:hypothetical protein